MATRDNRGNYVKDIFWQYLVLIIAIWIPLLIVSSHVYYFFETRERPYHLGIFRAIWLNFSISAIKRPCNKVWAGVSWLFLLFVLLLITADMASIIASADTPSSVFFPSDYCSTLPYFLSSEVNTLENCLNRLENYETNAVIFGNLQISTVTPSKLQRFIIRNSPGHEIFFNLLFMPGTNLSTYNSLITNYWKTSIIPQIYSKYSTSPTSFNRFSLVFQEFTIVFIGLSLLAFFGFIIALCSLFYKPLENSEIIEEEPSPSARSLLSKNPSHTISLDQSISNRLGSGRPDEWVDKAVDIQDENAHKIKNIQDYENELSAVKPAAPSFGSEKSILSMINSNKK